MRNHNGEMIYGPDSCVYPESEEGGQMSKREIDRFSIYNNGESNGLLILKRDVSPQDGEWCKYSDVEPLLQELEEKEKVSQRLRERLEEAKKFLKEVAYDYWEDSDSFSVTDWTDRTRRFLSESQKGE